MAKRKSKKEKPVTSKVTKNLKKTVSDNKFKFGAVVVAVILVAVIGIPFLSGFFVAPSPSLEGLWLTVITDDSCDICDYSSGTDFFEQYIPGINIREVSYKSPEGTNLMRTMNISSVPAFLFTEEITETDIYSQISVYLTRVSDMYKIVPIWITRLVDLDSPDNTLKFVKAGQEPGNVESTILAYLYSSIPNVVLEEYASSDSIGQQLLNTYGAGAPLFVYPEQDVTSDLVDAMNTYFSGQAIPDGCSKTQNELNFDTTSGMDVLTVDTAYTDTYPKSDRPEFMFFVMSFCPYGNLAEDFIEPVYQLLKDYVDFEPHYIFYDDYGTGYPNYCLDQENKYCAMHGIQEGNQNIRELCVYNQFGPDAFWEFVMEVNEKCSSSNADTCWEPIAQAQGLDVDAIKTCEQNEALTLAQIEVDYMEQYGATGSPTLFVNGVGYLGQRTSEDLKTEICCAFNTQPSECSQTLSGTTQSAQGSCE